MTDKVRVESRDGVVRITLTNPANGNKIGGEVDDAIFAALDALDETSRAILLAAEGDDFCMGRDFPASPDARRSAYSIRKTLAEPVLKLYGAVRQARVPVIARVRGRAAGAGCALAACADVVIASDNARFSVPELDRDTPPMLVMTALHGKISPSHAAYLVLSRAPVAAAEAFTMGLVSRVVPDAELDAECEALLAKLSTNSAVALQTVKAFAVAGDAPNVTPIATLAGSLIAVSIAEKG
ncbi:MAG: enoyl-CoA hydratase/isomerase family protein [Caulobacteraceae bacterium]|nr:enoyl-CoA hydratase/isomerase family protein [Caulobacteraceae bacterium]